MSDIKTCVVILNVGQHVNYRIDYLMDTPGIYQDGFINQVMPRKNYLPQKGDKIYFIPGCDVPRFKVKQFCENFNVSLVKFKEKANVKFVGPDSLKQYVTATENNFYSKSSVYEFLRKCFVDPTPEYRELIAAIGASTSAFVCIEYKASEYMKNGGLGLPFKHENVAYQDTPRTKFKNKESYEEFMNITSDPQLYGQLEILRRINTGGVMDKEQFVSIQRMLKSSDAENVKLAMEAMANCDYEKSCVPLLLLIKEYGNTLYNSSTRNHVNFKSLLKFFEITNLGNVNLDDIIKALLKRKLLNKANLDQLMPMAIQQMKEKAQLQYFKVKEVEVDSQITRGLQENVLDAECDTEVVEDPEEPFNPKGMPQF